MKRFISVSVFLFAICTLYAQIADSTKWTYIGRAAELPSTVSIPVVPKDDGATLHYVNVSLDATTYDNATQATAFAAIGAAVKTAISPTYIKTTMGLDTSDIVRVRLGITSIQRVWDNIALREKKNILVQAEDIFLVRVRVEIKRE